MWIKIIKTDGVLKIGERYEVLAQVKDGGNCLVYDGRGGGNVVKRDVEVFTCTSFWMIYNRDRDLWAKTEVVLRGYYRELCASCYEG
jgi:hypothetical protein